MISDEVRKYVKQRLAFASERWGASGALFAWDLWNEIHPAFAGDQPRYFAEFIEDVGTVLRDSETRLYGRAHLQTVSVFGPLITEGFQPQSFTVFTPVLARDPSISDCIFRHPHLDFASAHLYEDGTIDDPKNTIHAALSVGTLVRESLGQIKDTRPFVDTEYGPIHTYKDRHITLEEQFDDDHFRHVQWAHIASGEASGGMRRAQGALARFVSLVDWANFRRRNWNHELSIDTQRLRGAACGDDRQAVIWVVRSDTIGENEMLRRDANPIESRINLPEMEQGHYRVLAWDMVAGAVTSEQGIDHQGGGRLEFRTPSIVTDLAFAIRRVE